MTDRTAVRALPVVGPDRVEVQDTRRHQFELVPLIRRRIEDACALERSGVLVPSVERTPTCEVRVEGRVVGELPTELADEVLGGLLALATLEPPYLVEIGVELEWREHPGDTHVAATALVDLHDLRLLAS